MQYLRKVFSVFMMGNDAYRQNYDSIKWSSGHRGQTCDGADGRHVFPPGERECLCKKSTHIVQDTLR